MAQPPHDPAVNRAGQPRRRAPRAPRRSDHARHAGGRARFRPSPARRHRYDGWTPDRQRAFVKALAETGCVTRACAWVGMSNVGAYLLRKSEGAEAFAAAWDDALAVGVERLADIAYERAVYGVPVPVFHNGEQVGEKRRYNDRLLTWVMRHADRARYDDAPKGNRVPPHIRKALRAEWEAERQAEERLRADRKRSAAEELTAKLRQMADRMEGQPRHSASVAEFLAWALFGPPDPEALPEDWDGNWHPRSGYSPSGERLADAGSASPETGSDR